MPLKLKRRHGSPFWYIRGTVRSVSVDESTGVSEEKQAEALRAKREWEIISQEIGGRRSTATFLDATASYFENEGDPRFLDRIINHFGEKPLREIGQLEVEACARKLYPGRAPATLSRQVFTPISAVMRHAARRKLCDLSHFERPPQPRGRIRWITFEQSEVLLTCCSPHLEPLVTFLLYTGARVGEAMALDWRDVDLGRRHATFQNTKNGDRRGIPLHPRAVIALANIDGRKGPVFRRPDGLPYAPKDDGGGQIKTAFKGACARAGITDFHPHDCRHTWATWHYGANRDTAALMELGGWRSVQMVLRYAHVNVANLAEGVNKIGGDDPGTEKIEPPVSSVKLEVFR